VTIGQRLTAAGPRRGEIYRLQFREIGGQVLSGPHFAVVVQTTRMASSGTTLAVPVTSSAASGHLDPPYLVHASARDLQLVWDGWIHADQVATFPTSELEDRVGVLAGRKLEELDRALRFVLDV
jgi:mRNA-degrading endonuclease toxin of MazEF toxin-antitoxin module